MRWLAAAVLGWALLASANAQQATLEPSAAAQCLTPVGHARTPAYPPEAYTTRKPGRVIVRLRFTGPDTRPAVEVLTHDGDDSFVQAVQTHVRSFRVPCHAGGGTPVLLEFEFVFRDTDLQVLAGLPVDADRAQREAMFKCVRHESGDKAPDYPSAAVRINLQGRVLTRLTFTAPDQPPLVQMFATPPVSERTEVRRLTAQLDSNVQQWVAGYRMPCHQGGPVGSIYTFIYVIEGAGGFGFAPGLSLTDVLPLLRGIERQTLALDTTTMGCPFDIKWSYFQPALANGVREVGTPNPARTPLLEFLTQATLDVPRASLAAFYADTANLTVPCLKINLNPKE